MRDENIAVEISRREIVVCAWGMTASRTADVVPRWVHKIQSACGGVIAFSRVQEDHCVLSLDDGLAMMPRPRGCSPRSATGKTNRKNHIVQVEYSIELDPCFGEGFERFKGSISNIGQE